MIVVKIEMWPGGSEADMYPLGTMVIVNDGTSTTSKRGNYKFWKVPKNLSARAYVRLKPPTGRIDNWPRQSYSIWKLIKRCLETL